MPENAIEALAHALSGYSDTEWEPDHLPEDTKEYFRTEARRHALAVQRPSISYDEAQELHGIIGGYLRILKAQQVVEDVVEDFTRALEIAAIIVSDTDPDRDEDDHA